ncbi:MAG: exosortase-associated EpsI family protein [Nibricoccus sp.]
MKIRSVLILLGLVLGAAIALQVYSSLRLEREPVRAPLNQLVPRELAGWSVREGQVAETQEMKRAVGELLNFDDVVLRTYRRGGIEFEIYAAYWRPGKMSQRLIAGHTPDVCWVAAGWTMLEHGPGKGLGAFDAGMMEHAQQRVFKEPQGMQRYVLFWHLSGGVPVNYDVAGTPPWWAVFSDFKRFGLNQRRSQYFVRISSNVPFVELKDDAGFRTALAALKPVVSTK